MNLQDALEWIDKDSEHFVMDSNRVLSILLYFGGAAFNSTFICWNWAVFERKPEEHFNLTQAIIIWFEAMFVWFFGLFFLCNIIGTAYGLRTKSEKVIGEYYAGIHVCVGVFGRMSSLTFLEFWCVQRTIDLFKSNLYIIRSKECCGNFMVCKVFWGFILFLIILLQYWAGPAAFAVKASELYFVSEAAAWEWKPNQWFTFLAIMYQLSSLSSRDQIMLLGINRLLFGDEYGIMNNKVSRHMTDKFQKALVMKLYQRHGFKGLLFYSTLSLEDKIHIMRSQEELPRSPRNQLTQEFED